MTQDKNRYREMKLFAALAVAGVAAALVNVHILHIDVLIDGRWVFGFMGFALLRHWWAALGLAALLCYPYGTPDIPLWVGFEGNMLYAIPSLLTIRVLSGWMLRRWRPRWGFGLGWMVLVLFCYQVFTTPAVSGVIALMEGRSVGVGLMDGWRTQPFLVESILVALFSAVAMVAALALERLLSRRRRLEHINNVLLGIRSVNQIIMTEADPERLIEQACANLTETMGYRNAWIALMGGEVGATLGLSGNGPVSATAAAGFDGGFESLRERLERFEFSVCMKRAIDTGQTIVLNDPVSDCPDWPLSGDYVGRAALVCRMAFDGVTYGVLTASTPASYASNAEKQDLFNEVAGDLAFALHKIAAARRLEESRQHLDLAVEGAGIGTWEWNGQTNETVFNDNWAAMLGYTLDELTPYDYATVERLMHPEDLPQAHDALMDCVEGRKPEYGCEFRMQHKDGRWVWILDRGRIMTRDAEGKPLSMFGTHTDITEIKSAEENLRTREDLFSNLFEKHAAVKLLIDPDDGQIADANEAAETFYGWTRDELRRMNISDINTLSSVQVKAEMEKARKRERVYFEFKHRRADGSVRDVSVCSSTITFAGKEHLLSIVYDITERKQAEEALEREHAMLTRTEAVAHVGSWEWEVEGDNVTWSEELFRIFELEPAEEAPSFAVHQAFYVQEDRARLTKAVEECVKRGVPYSLEVRVTRADGELRYCFARGFPERDANGAVRRLYGSLHDITDIKRAEERITTLGRILDDSPAAITIHDTEGRFVFANSAAVSLHGYESIDEILEVNLYDLDVPETEALMAERFQKIAETGEARFEAEHYRKDGSTSPLEILAKRIEWKGKLAILSIATDITDRRIADDRLQESYALLHNLAALVPGVIYQYRIFPDGSSCFPYSSPGMWKIYEVTPEEVEQDATPVFGRLHPEDADRVSAAILESARTLETFYCEFRVILPEHGLRWRWSQAEPQRMGDGGTLWHGIIQDITDRKQAEEALRDSDSRVRTKLNALLDPEGDLGTLNLADVVDCDQIQSLMNDFYALTEIGVGILDLEGNVLVGTGWQDVCTEFHRVHPETARNCRESDTLLSSGVEPGAFKVYKYKNNMWDMATPIWVGERHVGNLFLGQFFFDDDEPDIDVFREQARRYGFDEDAYLKAYLSIPRWSRQKAHQAMIFYRSLIGALSRLSYAQIKLARATEALRESEQRFRSFVENATDVVFTLSPEGLFTYVSPNWLEFIGEPAEQAIGNSFEPYVHPEDVYLCRDALEKVVTTGKNIGNIEFRVRHQDGFWRWFISSGSPLQDESGSVTAYLGIGRDITDRKQAETDREKLQAQLTQSQKMESVGRLAGGVAHDFNNLLMGVMGYVDFCRDGIEADHPIREYLDEITSEAERCANLTRQLLAFARKQTIAPKVLDVNDAVAETLKLLRRLMGEDIALSWQPCSEIWPVKMDPGQFGQILVNLCVNARDAIDGVGNVTIKTANATIDEVDCLGRAETSPGMYVMLAVSDDGCGMDQETMQQVFEPFFTTKGVGEGSGLGLATIYGIVKQNEGFVDVNSGPGKGTTFRIYLPRIAGKDAGQSEVHQATKPDGGSETILLVEDEKSIRVTMALFLEKLGYAVLAADCPDEALRMAAEHPGEIHMLITDVVMPGMSGRDLTAELSRECPDLRCLYISGYTAEVIAHQSVLDDDIEFLAKPFTRDRLARKVRRILDHRN